MHSLLNFIKSNENSRRIFGKREIKIIEKQQLGVSLTQSEKNRLSRDIRKKFEFIRQACAFSGEFGLKHGSIIKTIIKESIEAILEDILFKDIKKIFLYGSAAENKLTLSSDIDIAVEFSDISIKEATLFRKRVSGRVNPRIDIQVCNHLPDKIKNEIKTKGKVLYEKQD